MLGSMSRMPGTLAASRLSASGVAVVCALYCCTWMSPSPYAERVASMFRLMYGASSVCALGVTWKRWTIAG